MRFDFALHLRSTSEVGVGTAFSTLLSSCAGHVGLSGWPKPETKPPRMSNHSMRTSLAVWIT